MEIVFFFKQKTAYEMFPGFDCVLLYCSRTVPSVSPVGPVITSSPVASAAGGGSFTTTAKAFVENGSIPPPGSSGVNGPVTLETTKPCLNRVVLVTRTHLLF